MTKQEHAQRINRTLKALHRALDAHHAAIAAAAVEFPDGIDEEIVSEAAVPKTPPHD